MFLASDAAVTGATGGIVPNLLAIAVGIVVGIAGPWLSRHQVNLPPPKTDTGRAYAVGACEGLATAFVSAGLNNLLGGTNLILDAWTVLGVVVMVVCMFCAFIADKTGEPPS
jgi:quinol-cytochrome oxidoreductase complex cytochrome b subunit